MELFRKVAFGKAAAPPNRAYGGSSDAWIDLKFSWTWSVGLEGFSLQ